MIYIEIKKKATKFGARGGHVLVPKGWIGKIISCHIAGEKEKKQAKQPQKEPPKAQCHIAPEFDEAEEQFLQIWNDSDQLGRNILYRRAIKQFGKDRTEEILGCQK